MTEHALGRWLRSAAHPRMWAMNQLYVEGPKEELTADGLAAELDRGLADARHRRAIVTDDATGRRLAAGMRSAGYSASALAVMLLEEEPPAPAPGVAREIDEPAMRALETRLVEADNSLPPEDGPVIIEGHAHMRTAMTSDYRARRFAGSDAGEDVCRVFLYTDGATGQPEDVATLAGHEGRGIAGATVALAASEAVRAGCDLVFILCSAETGPVALYDRLGFRVRGRFWTFNRRA